MLEKVLCALGATGIAASMALSAFAADAPCTLPAPAEPKMGRHGNEVWHDERLWTQPQGEERGPVAIPDGWIPLGQDHVEGNCAYFPEEQGILFINPQQFTDIKLEVEGAPFFYRVYYLPETQGNVIGSVLSWLAMLTERVLPVFPKGVGDPRPFDVLVTSGMTGKEGDVPENMVFPAPGIHLLVVSRPLDGDRAHQLLAHTLVHIFNRYHMPQDFHRFEQDPTLSIIMYQEMVATWFEFVTARTPAERNALLDKLWVNYNAAMDGLPHTKPEAPTLMTARHFPERPTRSMMTQIKPVKVFYEYYVMPLIALALDEAMHRLDPEKSIKDLFQSIHDGTYATFSDAVAGWLGSDELAQVRRWLDEGVLIPEEDVRNAVERLNQPS
ncbi:MAG: hypothetical protein GC134_06460 [Proteobacteria bacterium]|nr:hypothetical protein [Pseudomonadota bacterium]